jgi:hypothetical protein
MSLLRIVCWLINIIIKGNHLINTFISLCTADSFQHKPRNVMQYDSISWTVHVTAKLVGIRVRQRPSNIYIYIYIYI